MRWIHEIAYRLRALFFSKSLDSDTEEEMAFHLQMETRKYVQQGMSEDEARRRAVKEFGSVTRQRERAREAWGITTIRDALQDARHAFRQLRRNPAFTVAALVTLAVGIGANTAIFSITDQVLLRRPQVDDPHRLAALYTTCRRGFPKCSSSYPDFIDYRDRSRSFTDIAGYNSVPLNIGAAENARLGLGQPVSGNYFALLGVNASLGRVIQPSDDVQGRAAPVAVVSHSFWQNALGSDTAAVGETIRLNGAPFTVIGIAPEGFQGMELNVRPDVWIPMFAGPYLGPSAGAVSGDAVASQRGNRWISTLVGRLANGATVRTAQLEMDALALQLGEEFPEARAAAEGVRGTLVDPASAYLLPVVGAEDVRSFVYLLFGVVGFSLLLASTNIANLLLARASARAREIGVRLAVGARRGRLVRQLMVESVVLALLGGGAGLVVAMVMLDLLGSFDLPGGVSIGALATGLDGRVLTFALLLSLFAAVVFGLAPALQATRRDLVSTMKGETSARGGVERWRLRKTLVGVQVALCLVLLMGSGLFIRTLRNSMTTDVGFEPRGAAAARFNLGLLQWGPEETAVFIDDLLGQLRGSPQVDAAAVGTLIPFQAGGFRGTFAEIPAYDAAPDEQIRFDYLAVTPGYFDALGIDVVEGRVIESADVQGGRAVAVVNQLAAERYWPNGGAVGGAINADGMELEVVGVVDNPTWRQVGEPATPFVFVAAQQFPTLVSGGFLTVVARTSGDPTALLPLIRSHFRETVPGLSLTFANTMEEQLRITLMPQRMGMTMLTLFGGVALLLAGVGIYGVVGYTVMRRAREIGIRIAVGASRTRIIRGVMKEMAPSIVAGLAIGTVVALALGRTVEAFMFRVDPQDPVMFGAVSLVLLLVATVAVFGPARRAAGLDPVKVLTTE